MKFILTFSLLVLGLASFGGKAFFDVAGSKPEQYRSLGKRTASYEVNGDKLIITIPPFDLSKPSDRWPGILIKPNKGRYFDLSEGSVMAVDVRNLTSKPVQLQCEMVILGKKREFAYNANGGIGLEPGEKGTMRVRYLRGGNPDLDWMPGGLLVNFDGFGALKHHLIPDKVEQIRFFVLEPEVEHRFELSNFRLEEPPAPLPAALSSKESFYPCIDRFGQYKHAEWPGKIHDEAELKKYTAAEAADLAAHPVPADRTPYGGWASGPDYPATGSFYPVKHDGKWFLVDPSGKLFWSLGMDTVNLDNQESVTGLALREHYFEALPPRDEAKWCYSTYRPRRRYYKEQGVKETECVSFLQNNLRLKDGGSRKEVHAAFYDRALKRLKSWGFNTLGNWTNRSAIAQKKLAYADSLYIPGEVIPGDRGTWRKFHEVFSPNFEKTLIANIKKYRASSVNDPWCIGFFVDNELSWGDDAGLVRGVLRSPAGQPSKIAFSERLKAKYGSVEKLNQAWGSSYRSWQDFLETTELPDEKRAWDDLVSFNTEIINLYFSKIRKVFDTVLPGKLYLGCRFPNVGSEGYMLANELRIGSQHSENGAVEFLRRCLEQVKALKIDLRQIVVRVDSGHDDRKFIKALDEYGVKFIIKRNLRGEPRERYLELGKQYGAKQLSREGKNVWHYSWGNIPVDKSDELFDAEEESMRGTMTMVVAATERQTHAKTGEVFLFPEIEIDSWWTNIDCTEEECIAGYHDHGTSEQFHSELKTDMNIEKLPSGKFATNALILNIAALAFNCLRIMGQRFLNKPQLLHREYKVARRRLRSVMQDLIYIACKVVKHAGYIWLSFGRGNPHYRIFKDLYARC